MLGKKKQKVSREGRIARYIRMARQVRAEPRHVFTLVREGLLNVWRARGGGFYGLGYLVAFLVLEIRMFAGDVGASSGVVEFVASQVFQFLFRFTVQSLVNVVLALVWPLYLLQWLGAWGFLVLGGGYLCFEKGLRPTVETWFPELRVEEPAPASAKSSGDSQT